MNRVCLWNILRGYQWLAGLCDTATGLLLVLAPEWTLRAMRIQLMPPSPEMVSFVGVFVLAVGAGYLTTTRVPRTEVEAAGWVRVWMLTGISRGFVAAYVAWQLALGRMELAWASVLVTDALLAGTQMLGISRGWLVPLPPAPLEAAR